MVQHRLAWGLTAILAAGAVRAMTIIPPPNLGDLAITADAVVLAEAIGNKVSRRGQLLFTITSFRAVDQVSGPLTRGDLFTVQAPGGELDGIGWTVPGSPRFTPGNTYLLFLAAKPTGEWLPAMMSWGLLERVRGRTGLTLLAPIASSTEVMTMTRSGGTRSEGVDTYREVLLLPHLRRVVAGRIRWSAGTVRARAEQLPLTLKATTAPGICTFMTASQPPHDPFRWHTFDSGGAATMHADATGDLSLPPEPPAAGGGFTQVLGALADWDGIPGTSIKLNYGGRMAFSLTCTAGQDTPPAGVNIVIFNDPCDDIPAMTGCSGVLGFGGPWSLGIHTFDGRTWNTITSWFMVVNDGAGCLGTARYQLMLEHEFGHGMGFDHVADTSALMYEMCCHPINATDRTCAQYLYPPAQSPTPTPTPAPFTASFTFAPATPLRSSDITFVDTSPGKVFSSWDLGDGRTRSGPTVVHRYAGLGPYTVTLTSTAADGITKATTSRQVIIHMLARRHLHH